VAGLFLTAAARVSFGGVEIYPRVGYQATLSTQAHGVSGRVTIVDQDTFRIDNFNYDGGGISVYAYLGTANNHAAFVNGLQTGPQLLGMHFHNGTLIVDLPAGQTLDGYNAISIWCVAAQSSFGSGTFQPPSYPRAGYSAVLAQGGHNTSGVATIVDERTIRLTDFTYDGFAPQVYAHLGRNDYYPDLAAGPRMFPQLTQAYSDDTLIVQLPMGESLDGYGAISIWCETFNINFTSNEFPRPPHDLDIDGDIDLDDAALFSSCHLGPETFQPETAICTDSDMDNDDDVDLQDFSIMLECFDGAGVRALPGCRS